MVIADINIGVLYVFAVSSLGVYGIVLAGWASNSKYPFLGGIRSTSQMISYELALGLSVIPVFMLCGTLNMPDIVNWQRENGWMVAPFWAKGLTWEVLLSGDLRAVVDTFVNGFSLSRLLIWVPMLISFIIFLIAMFAETNRAPFDLPEAEQELVGGYHTEYSGIKLLMYLVAEFLHMVTAAFLIVILFLGGWHFWGITGASDEIAWPVAVLRVIVLLVKVMGEDRVVLGSDYGDDSRRVRERNAYAAFSRTATVYQPPRGAAA